MQEVRGGNSGASSSSGQEADDMRIFEHVRTVLAQLKSRLQERHRGDDQLGRVPAGSLSS